MRAVRACVSVFVRVSVRAFVRARVVFRCFGNGPVIPTVVLALDYNAEEETTKSEKGKCRT